MADYLDTLSEFVARTHLKDLRREVKSAVSDVVLDTLGAIVGGSRLPENAAFARLAAKRSSPATATIFGHSEKAEPMYATLVNATAGVALEMDEGNRFGGGHPAIHVLPGAVAVAEEMGASGRQLAEAILVGYEVESRVGGATVPRDNVHSHGHWGTIGTAAAVAKLRDYSPEQVRSVINLAASMSPANTWTPCFEGATIRNLYPGRSGLQGILADHLFQCGFTGLADGPTDVFGSILGESFDPQAAVRGLGGTYRIEQNYFKFYACCRYNHPALEAVLSLRRREKLSPEQVEAVDVVTALYPAGMVGDYPRNMLGAKFSIPYAVAAALVRDAADVPAFFAKAMDDGRIRALAARVSVEPDPEMSARSDDSLTARVSVRLKDGRVLSETTGIVRGDAGNPVPREELVDKFFSLTTDILGQERAQAVVETVDRLEGLSDVGELTTLLRGD